MGILIEDAVDLQKTIIKKIIWLKGNKLFIFFCKKLVG